jgi:hypothetical protein
MCSSNYPLFAVHPGTDQNPFFASKKVRTEHIITIGGSDGASLELPTVDIAGLARGRRLMRQLLKARVKLLLFSIAHRFANSFQALINEFTIFAVSCLRLSIRCIYYK